MFLFERGRLVDGTHQAKVVVMFYANIYAACTGMLPHISMVFDMAFWLSKGDWMWKGKEKRMERWMNEGRQEMREGRGERDGEERWMNEGRQERREGRGERDGEERGMKVVPSVGLTASGMLSQGRVQEGQG